MRIRKHPKAQGRYPVKVECPEKSNTAKMPAAVKDLEEVLRAASRKIRRGITLHIVDARAITPYPQGRILHVVVGAAPAGDVDQTDLSHACGIRLQERGRYLAFWGPTRGIGTKIIDEQKNIIGQIVDGTVYLFIPTPGRASFLFEGSEGRELYKRCIERALKTLRKGCKEPKSKKIVQLDDYRAFVDASFETMPMLLGARKALVDLEIQTTTEKLRTLYTEKETYSRLAALEKERTDVEKREHPVRDWPRIKKHPLVERVFVVEGEALHVQTRRIIAEHNGKHFDMGRYIIRLTIGGTPSIWAVDSTHPKRVAHPHISAQSVVCFGNVTTSVTQAAGEGRIADALDIIFRWLTEGYDPNLADAKIEEWPEVRRKKRKAA